MFDYSKLYFGEPIKVTNNIILKQPKMAEIVNVIGEKKYFYATKSLTAISSDLKSFLWDNGKDWEKVTDLDVFVLMTQSMDKSDYSFLFESDVDFSEYKPIFDDNEENIINYINFKTNDYIDSNILKVISNFLCITHSYTKKREKAFNKKTKEILIQLDRESRKKIEELKPEDERGLFNLMSYVINDERFKYDIDGLKQLTYFQFMDSVSRIMLKESVLGLMTGYYTGNIDTKKFDIKKLNSARDMY